jgi:hypothetical protein
MRHVYPQAESDIPLRWNPTRIPRLGEILEF